MDGSKHRMNIEAIVNLIEGKSKGEEKQLEASIHGSTIMPTIDDDVYISIKAVNKSLRPIIINSYGIEVPEKEKIIMFTPYKPKYLEIDTSLPCTLEDGEGCRAFLSRKDFEGSITKEGWDYPIDARAIFNTNDGKFYSDIIQLTKI